MRRGRYIRHAPAHPAPFAITLHRREADLTHCSIDTIGSSSAMASRLVLLLVVLVAAVACARAAPSPFFDAIYDAVLGNGRRTYGYSNGYSGYNNGYNGYGAGGYNGYNGYGGGYDYGYRQQHEERAPRQGKSYKEICRVHFPDSVAVPGTGGIVCPY